MLVLFTVLIQKNGAGKGIPQHADPRMEIWLPQVEVQGRLTTKCRDMHCSNLFPVSQPQKSTRAPATYLQVPPLPSAVEAMGGHAPNGVVASPQTIPNKENPSRRPVTGLSGLPLQKAVGLSLAVPTSTHPSSPFQRMVPETLEPWNLASQLSPSSLPFFSLRSPLCLRLCVASRRSGQLHPEAMLCTWCGLDGVGRGGTITFPGTCVHPVFSYLLTHPFLIPLNPFFLAHPALLSFPFHCFLALS